MSVVDKLGREADLQGLGQVLQAGTVKGTEEGQI